MLSIENGVLVIIIFATLFALCFTGERGEIKIRKGVVLKISAADRLVWQNLLNPSIDCGPLLSCWVKEYHAVILNSAGKQIKYRIRPTLVCKMAEGCTICFECLIYPGENVISEILPFEFEENHGRLVSEQMQSA